LATGQVSGTHNSDNKEISGGARIQDDHYNFTLNNSALDSFHTFTFKSNIVSLQLVCASKCLALLRYSR